MPLPQMHGRTHVPAGYSVVVKTGDPTIDQASSDQLPCTTQSSSGGTPVEWIYLASTTNWGTSLTDLTFAESGGSYDTGTPTFDLTSGDLTINKAGSYDFHAYIISYNNSFTVFTHLRSVFTKVSGPSAAGPHGWVTANYTWLKPVYWPSEPISFANADPFLHTFAHWDDGDFVGTPFRLNVSALKYWDGVEEAENDAVYRLLVTRIGDPYA